MGSIVSVKERARKKTMVITSFGSPNNLRKQHQKPLNLGNRTVAKREWDVEQKSYENTEKDKARDRTLINTNNGRAGSKETKRESQKNDNSFTYINGTLENLPETNKVQKESKKHLINRGERHTDFHPLKNRLEGDGDAVDEVKGRTDERACKEADRKEYREHGTEDFIRDVDNSTNNSLASVQVNVTKKVQDNASAQLAPSEKSAATLNARGSTPVSQAVGSWGEGVIGTSTHALDRIGHVTSRGMDAAVKSSADYYHDFAYVSSYKSPIHVAKVESNIKSHTGACHCRKCSDTRRREKAAVKIQCHLRAYQARKEMVKRKKSVVKIQRIYRAKIQKRLSEHDHLMTHPGTDSMPSENILRTHSRSSNHEIEMLETAKENFELYQDDITELKWQSQQLIEIANMGEDYAPQKILLISSNVQRPEWLARVTLNDVHVIMYQFSQVTFKDLLNNIALSLADYCVGSKAKRIAFVCQGGPGYVYICKGKVLTSKKIEKEPDLQEFLKELGSFISKRDPSDAKIHFIGSNILGNKKGVLLLQDMQKAMHPARVSIESPLEISERGYEMLTEYFNIDLYKIWKKNRYTRIRINGIEE